MANAAVVTSKEILYLPIDSIRSNPYQPRKFFGRASLEELACSIREYGVMQPITVRLINGYSYELVAGERRLRASKLAGIKNIPSVVVNINDQESAILAIIENLQRQNLNYLEEAEGFQNLMQDYSFTQEELAFKVGKNQSTIANKIRILRLSKQIQKALLENDLSERHARALLRLDTEELQWEVIHKVIMDNLNVKKTEDLIEKTLKQGDIKSKARPNLRIKRHVKDIRLFTNTIKNAVEIMNSSGVHTDYFLEENENGCEIKIRVMY